MIKPKVKIVDATTWPTIVASMIMTSIAQANRERGSCSVMLTGGRNAARLYEAWAALPEFDQLSNVYFYLGDERCVPPYHPESNYALVMQTIFQKGIPNGCLLFRMEADVVDRVSAAQYYESLLPDALDILLLSVGEDGHIASLFPGSPALQESQRLVTSVTCLKPPHQRLTITPPVIQKAREVMVLALGEQKRVVYEEALRVPSDIDVIPARLVLNRTWIFGE
jgi:6-phosphogluconolactonase